MKTHFKTNVSEMQTGDFASIEWWSPLCNSTGIKNIASQDVDKVTCKNCLKIIHAAYPRKKKTRLDDMEIL